MKLPFPNEARSQKPEVRSPLAGLQPSTFSLQPAQRGVALVITLIMLSVTLVMAIAFLAISRRERNSVSTTTDTTVARLAADSALAAAQAQIVANIFATTNLAAYNFHTLVSTNYQNPLGFDPTSSNPTNVNFDYQNQLNSYAALGGAEMERNIGNLFYLPRVPVSIYNPTTGSNDFRFYLDLNRNGRFETNGLGPVMSGNVAFPFFDIAGNLTNDSTVRPDALPSAIATTFNVGDPEWIGLLEHPDAPHGPNNHFVSRYAFFAQPIGNSLDVNAIHNQTMSSALSQPLAAANDGYFRNEGLGSWELNLAAFLVDINTNAWNPVVNPYYYQQPGLPNKGAAFEDAQGILAWRYGFNYNSLTIPTALTYSALVNRRVDGYNVGNALTNFSLPAVQTPINQHWVGSDNTNRFFALPSELFDTSKVGVNFATRLVLAGAFDSTYDRYTYYRLLDQLGTDSTSTDARLNLNYNNVQPAFNGVADVNGTANATNLLDWTPLAFFTNAANRLIAYHTAQWWLQNFYNYTHTFGVTTTNPFTATSIPVYINGQFVYTPAVNRLLQLAANIYDASTNDIYPSVFRPLFTRQANNDVFITGFAHIASVAGDTDVAFSTPFDIQTFSQSGGVNVPVNIYGVPWIVEPTITARL